MAECKVAVKLDPPVFQDVNDNTCDELNAFGLKCTHHLVHPEMCLVVDEVRSILNQTGDSHIGGQNYFCERGTVPQYKVQHRDNHFTLLGFTALSGDPILCVIIISGADNTLA